MSIIGIGEESGPQRTDVYSIDGHLIGTVAEGWASEYASSRTLAGTTHQTGVGYFRVTRPKGDDLFVPMSALADYTDERLRVRFTKAQIGKQGWNKRPADLPRD
jgi:hypothetical protein